MGHGETLSQEVYGVPRMTLEVVCWLPHACTNMIIYTHMCMYTHRDTHTLYTHTNRHTDPQFITSFISRPLSGTERDSVVDANVDCIHRCGSTCGCQCIWSATPHLVLAEPGVWLAANKPRPVPVPIQCRIYGHAFGCI